MRLTLQVYEVLEHEIEVELTEELMDRIKEDGYDNTDATDIAQWAADLSPSDEVIVDEIGDVTVVAVPEREVRGAHVEE